ncbi:MAG: MFS transporter [SAR324 cluster bacterium]|nr:MFS transporter [SAR324 cluster bacterium]
MTLILVFDFLLHYSFIKINTHFDLPARLKTFQIRAIDWNRERRWGPSSDFFQQNIEQSIQAKGATVNTENGSTASSHRFSLLVLLCAFIAAGIAFGIRQSFGLFMLPMTLHLGWGRETLSLVFAIQALLNGFAAPFSGAIADKWGTGRTVLTGGFLYACGLLIMSQSTIPATMVLGGGLFIGMGISACGMPILLAAVGKIAPDEKRSQWLGAVTVGATAGQLVIIPAVQWTIAQEGWSATLIILSAFFLLFIPLSACFGIAGRQSIKKKSTQSLKEALAEAQGHRGYVLLTLGFFVCGFQVQFMATHLPAFIEDKGLGSELAASSLGVIAFFNMFGALIAGYLGGKFSKKYLLTSIYLARALTITLFISLPVTEFSVLAFSAIIGFIWLGTVPLTSGLVAQIFGLRYMATLFAIVYLSHQTGNFAGAWVGGIVFDATGSYHLVWWIAVGLGLVAALMHAPINDLPLERLSAAD